MKPKSQPACPEKEKRGGRRTRCNFEIFCLLDPPKITLYKAIHRRKKKEAHEADCRIQKQPAERQKRRKNKKKRRKTKQKSCGRTRTNSGEPGRIRIG